MKRAIRSALILNLALAAMLCAAPFWVEKPYTAWTEKETGKLLSDSPWARPAQVEIDFSSMPQGEFGGRGGMGGRGGGMGGPGGPGGGMPQINATVMWRSALPVRQAMYQAATLQESNAAEQLAKQLEVEPEYHIIAVTGLPAMGGPGMGRRPGQTPSPDAPNRPEINQEQREEMRKQMESRMLEATRLVFGKDEIAPEKMETVQLESGRVLVFFFPKSFEIDPKGKDLMFRTQMGPMKLSSRFKPKDMVFAAKR